MTTKVKTRTSFVRWVERALWVLGLSCGLVVAQTWRAGRVSAQAARAFGDGPALRDAVQEHAVASHDEAVIGRLEIPAVKLTVPVLANFDPDSLKRGVGHIPNTAMPGGLGNMGLAGHRDTYFRSLRNVRKGMLIEVRNAEGKYSYQIESMEIVNPDQVEVLDIRDRPEMTLITCYPFEFIGQAPQRFIVHARLLSLDPG